MEAHRVIKDDAIVAVSLPLENLFSKLCRIGLVLMRVGGDPFLRKAKSVPITETPQYHYAADIESYDDMAKLLKQLFNPSIMRYTPIGFLRSVNINAIHILQKKLT